MAVSSHTQYTHYIGTKYCGGSLGMVAGSQSAEDEVPKEDVVELKRRLTTLEEDVRVLKQKLASVSAEGAAEGSAEGAAAAP